MSWKWMDNIGKALTRPLKSVSNKNVIKQTAAIASNPLGKASKMLTGHEIPTGKAREIGAGVAAAALAAPFVMPLMGGAGAATAAGSSAVPAMAGVGGATTASEVGALNAGGAAASSSSLLSGLNYGDLASTAFGVNPEQQNENTQAGNEYSQRLAQMAAQRKQANQSAFQSLLQDSMTKR